jgi:integrase
MARRLKESTDTKNLMKRGSVWYVKRMVDGKLIIQSTKQTDVGRARMERDRILNPFNLRDEKERAEAVFARVSTIGQQLAVIENDVPGVTIRHGWQAYLDQHNRPDSGPVTLSQYEGWYEAFARWFEETFPRRTDADKTPGAWELRDVTQEHADRYAGHLLKRVSATTFNRHINLLTLVWRVLGKKARLTDNPWKQIGRKRFQVHSRRELTLDELRRVCEAAQGEMRLLLAVGIYTGVRLGDAACLEWGSVDMVKGVISLIPSKTARRSQKRVTIPIHATLYAMLAECPDSRRNGYVMPSMAARYQAFNAALTKDITKLFLSVGIKTNPNAMTATEKEAFDNEAEKARAEGREVPVPKKSAARARVDCGYHSLRHTFVSLCAAGGVSQSVVQALVGHGSPSMTAHYTHIGIETAKRAVAALPDVTGAEAAGAVTVAAGGALEGVLAGLEGLGKEDLEKVVARATELLKDGRG